MSKSKIKQADSSPKRMSTTCFILVIDLVAIIFIVVGSVIDIFVANDDYLRYWMISFDSVIGLGSMFFSYFIPKRNEKLIDKYVLTIEEYDYLGVPPSSIYLNLYISFGVVIIADVFFCVFNLSYALVASLLVELLFIGVFLSPVFMMFIMGDKAVINRTANKFLKLGDYKKGKHFIMSNDFTPSDNYTNEGKQVEKLIGSILFNNDWYLLFIKIYKKLKTDDYDKNKTIKNNLYEYFIYAISTYLDSIEFSFQSHVRDDKQFHLIICNIRDLKLHIDLFLKDGFLEMIYYEYITNALYKLGNATTNYPEFGKNLSEILDIIKMLDENSFKTDENGKPIYNCSSLYGLDCFFFRSLIDGNKWFIEKYPNVGIKNQDDKIHYYISFVVFFFSMLKATHIDRSKYGSNERQKYFDEYGEIVKKLYGSSFYLMVDFMGTEEFINLYYYLKEIYECSSFVNDINNNNLYILTDIDCCDDQVMIFWFVLLLIWIVYDKGFYDELCLIFPDEIEEQILALCHFYKEDASAFDSVINSLIEYGFKGDEYNHQYYDHIAESVDYILDTPNRNNKYKKLKEDSGLKPLIDNLNEELHNDIDFIDINDIPNGTRNVMSYNMELVYCLDEKNPMIKEACGFVSKEDFLQYLFSHINSIYHSEQKGQRIQYFTDSILDEINEFDPDYAYISKECQNCIDMTKINGILNTIEQPHKYLSERYLALFSVFYKRGAIKFYCNVSYEKTSILPACRDDYKMLIDYFSYQDCYDEFYSLDNDYVLDCICTLNLYVEYYVEFDFDKMLIYYPSIFTKMDDDENGNADT